MSTISKEQCATAINDFYRTKSFNEAMILVKYYLEDYDEYLSSSVINIFTQYPMLINTVIAKVIKDLETKYKLIEVTKDNIPILVY